MTKGPNVHLVLTAISTIDWDDFIVPIYFTIMIYKEKENEKKRN